MYRTILLIIFFSIVFLINAENNRMLNKHDFFKYIKEKDLENSVIEITVKGEEKESFRSKNKYVYFEDVVYFGKNDIKSEFYNPWIVKDHFILIFNDVKIRVNFRDIRTFLSESYKKTYLKHKRMTAPEDIKEFLKNKAKKVLVCEYGLKKGQKYYAIFHIDHYYINGENGPEERTNPVIWITDKPFLNGKPQIDITPAYKGWTY